jgi:MOSC domain-containing protein YiiM
VSAILTQVNVSPGGMPKFPVLSAHVSIDGIASDRQRIAKIHGGPNRAVCLYSEELYEWLRSRGVSVSNGDIGENFTTRGLDLATLKTGDRLRVGQCTIEITKVREPCSRLRKWDEDLPEIIVGHSGWMAKVIEEGAVKPGDAIEITGASEKRQLFEM